jgi:hypothetical protein
MVLSVKNICQLNNINYVIFVMMKCGVLFEVRTELLNIIWTSFVFQKVNSYELLTILPVLKVLYPRYSGAAVKAQPTAYGC